jgi:hypothetical protein
MIRFVVWITLPSGERVRCGEVVCSDPEPNGKIEGAFRYSAEWLEHPNGFALDPNELPLVDTEFAYNRPQGIFSVFEDSLPDDWGRRLLIRKAGLGRGQQNLPNLLLALNGNGLGALSYYVEAPEPQHPISICIITTTPSPPNWLTGILANCRTEPPVTAARKCGRSFPGRVGIAPLYGHRAVRPPGWPQRAPDQCHRGLWWRKKR